MLAAASRAAEPPLSQRGGWHATHGQGVPELLRALDVNNENVDLLVNEANQRLQGPGGNADRFYPVGAAVVVANGIFPEIAADFQFDMSIGMREGRVPQARLRSIQLTISL